jgi:hypothetical protein
MNKHIHVLATALSALAFAGCGQKTQQQKIDDNLGNIYALNGDDRQMAEINAKKFYEKNWRTVGDASERGAFNYCRPSDSNANGLVSCFGTVPQLGGGYKEIKMFCGYRKDLVGCSDEDTVK